MHTKQIKLDFNPSIKSIVANIDESTPSIVRRFFEFHRKHPEIYKHFKKYAHDLLGSRPTRTIGSQMIIERIRYEIYLTEDDVEIFKINNSFAPGYARLFMHDHPEYNGLINTRDSMFDEYIPLN